MGLGQSSPNQLHPNQNISHQTMSDLDIERYMGEWYEIAKYPFKYQTDCDRAKAIYKWDSESEKILVENQCWVRDQMVRSRTAKAWVPDKSDKGKLLIKFDGFPRDPQPGDYWVHWTDYRNAIVGGPRGDMLWWLSRNPTVKAQDVKPMLRRIQSYGYNTDRLMAHPTSVTK
jgi:apolipoprotein D and lipocalin family protein